MANSPLTLSELACAERSGDGFSDDAGVPPVAEQEPLLLAGDPPQDPFSLGIPVTDGKAPIHHGRTWSFYYGNDGDDVITLEDGYVYGEDGRQILTTDHDVNEVYGGAGNDRLRGNSGIDWLYGQGGDDIIHGGDNWDILNGGDGNDEVYGDAGDDRIAGGRGHDRLYGGEGEDTIFATDDDVGTDNSSEIYGEAGNDRLMGGRSGTTLMQGGAGNDCYGVDDPRDTVDETGGTGVDTVFSTVSFSLARTKGAVENLTLAGTAFSATGNGLANALTGNAGNNELCGEAGNDRLSGKGGSDLMTGGRGADLFVFDTAPAAFDRITDFSVPDDTIALDHAVFTRFRHTGALPAGFLAVNGAGIAFDRDDYLTYSRHTGVLAYDADGSGHGAAVRIALLSPGLALTARDFLIL